MRVNLGSQRIAPYVLISPFFLLFAAFGLYPIGYSIVMSLYNWGLVGPQGRPGIQNYLALFTTDPFFMRSLLNTLVLLVFGSLTQHVIGFPLAIVLKDRLLKGRDAFRTLFFLPYITSTVPVCLIFLRLLDNNYGWLNWLIADVFGGPRINFVTEPGPIKAAISLILNWRYIGWCAVVYLAGIQAIPQELYESAMIDGAGSWIRHTRVTLPMIMPVVFFNVSLTVIFGLQLFEEPYVWTGGYAQLGGTGNSGLTTAFYLMHQGFRGSRFGRASSIAWVMFIMIIALTWVTRRITRRAGEQEG
jgi:ABC-type sugar transport system permease subunit